MPFECTACGYVAAGDQPLERCPKCGGFAWAKARPPFPEIDCALQRALSNVRSAVIQVRDVGHRKAAFITANLRRAEESIVLAVGAVNLKKCTENAEKDAAAKKMASRTHAGA